MRFKGYVSNERAVVPLNEDDIKVVGKLVVGKAYDFDVVTQRVGAYHRRVFALLKFAYENTDPIQIEYKGHTITQSFDRFRKDLVIIAGFYSWDVNSRGEVRAVADSLKYSKCNQEKVERVYSALLDVIAERIFQGTYTNKQLSDLSEQWMRYV